MLKQLRDLVMLWKIYLTRSLAYVSILNSVMILFLTLSDLKKYGIEIAIGKWIIPIIITGTILLIVLGWVEDKLGAFSKENELRLDRWPQFNTILKKLDRMEKQLEELKNNNK